MNTELIGIIITSVVALPASVAALMVAIRQCRARQSETAPPVNPALTTPPTTAPVAPPVAPPVAAPVAPPVAAPVAAPESVLVSSQPTTERYIMNYGQSKPSTMNGPWPTNCKEIRVRHDVHTHDEAVRIAKEQISKDPENHIIEVVESFIPPTSWTYTVKTYRTEDGTTSNVRIDTGRRFVAWDMSKFKYREKVMQTLKENDFF